LVVFPTRVVFAEVFDHRVSCTRSGFRIVEATPY
jgi:hypothetical protein